MPTSTIDTCLSNRKASDATFNAHNVLTVRIPLLANRYAEPPQARAFYQQLLDRVKGLPGVEHAAVTTSIPLTGWNSIFGLEIPGRPAPPPGQTLEAEFIAISPDYMGAMGIPLLRGRLLSDSDSETSSNVIVINETMARRHWPNEEAVGKQIKDGPDLRNIVGVVSDVKQDGLSVPSREQIYVSIYQMRALSTTELSQGQRKRLALLAAYLEDRPIYVFDEWAADQDPHFKEIFTCSYCRNLRRGAKPCW